MKEANELLKIVSEFQTQARNISADAWNTKKSPDKWSKKEILGHLIDSAIHNYKRFLRSTTQDNLRFGGYDQVNFVKLNNYQSRSTEEILLIWKAINIQIARLLEVIPAALLSKKTTDHNFHLICMRQIKQDAETNLIYLIRDYIFHIEHHLNQINK